MTKHKKLYSYASVLFAVAMVLCGCTKTTGVTVLSSVPLENTSEGVTTLASFKTETVIMPTSLTVTQFIDDGLSLKVGGTAEEIIAFVAPECYGVFIGEPVDRREITSETGTGEHYEIYTIHIHQIIQGEYPDTIELHTSTTGSFPGKIGQLYLMTSSFNDSVWGEGVTYTWGGYLMEADEEGNLSSFLYMGMNMECPIRTVEQYQAFSSQYADLSRHGKINGSKYPFVDSSGPLRVSRTWQKYTWRIGVS